VDVIRQDKPFSRAPVQIGPEAIYPVSQPGRLKNGEF
jgi:hypothetical protein